MAAPKSKLYYWNGERWDAVLTADGSNAVIGIEISDALANSRKAMISITNRAPDRRDTDDSTKRKGPHTNKFTLFRPILLKDQETQQIIYSGFTYSAKNRYDPQYGDVISLEAFDSLAELRDYPAKKLGVDIANQGNKRGIRGSTYNTRLKMIEYLIEHEQGVESDSLAVVDKASHATSGTTIKKSRSQLSVYEIGADLMLEHASRSVLQTISELALDDPHNASRFESIGYDYYVDPNFMYPEPSSSTTLAAECSSTATTLTVASTTQFLVGEDLLIDDEQMTIASIVDSTTLTVNARTGGVLHNNGSIVKKAWILPNGNTYKQEFNYHKRGSRPMSENFDTNGLTIMSPTASDDTERGVQPRDGTTTLPARRFMLANADFADPIDSLNSHAIVTFHGRSESSNTDLSDAIEDRVSDREEYKTTHVFELLYVYGITENSGDSFACFPRFKGSTAKRISTENNKEVHGIGAAEQFSVYRAEDGTPQFDVSTRMAQNCGVIQFNSNSTGGVNDSPANMEHILVSDLVNTGANKFPIDNYSGDDYVYIRGETSGAYCKFNASPNITASWQGRPSKAWRVKRPVRFTYRGDDHPDGLRQNVVASLRRLTNDIRRGTFSTIRGPYFYLDVQIDGTPTNSGSLQRNMSFDNIDGTTNVNLYEYGVKQGMTIRFYGTDKNFQNEVAHGQILLYSSDTNITVNLDKITTTDVADNHYARIYIPLRAGDALRVNNFAQDINGNHLITATTYAEGPGKTDCVWKTTGENSNTADVFNVPGGAKTIATVIDLATGDNLREEVGIGQLGWVFEPGSFAVGVSGSNKLDRIEWTAGTFSGGSGTESITAGNTYTKLGGGLANTNPATIYYIYYDPAQSRTEFQVSTAASYLESPNKVRLVWVQYGNPQATFGIFGNSSPGQSYSSGIVSGTSFETGTGLEGVIRINGADNTIKFYGSASTGAGGGAVDGEIMFHDQLTASYDEYGVLGIRSVYYDSNVGSPTTKWRYTLQYGQNQLFYSQTNIVNGVNLNATPGNQVESNGAFSCYYTNYNDLGTSSLRWKAIYLNSSPDVSSDERMKTNIVDFSTADSLAFIDTLRPRKFNFTTNPDDLSYGLIAQEVETALEGLSIDKTKLDLITLPKTASYEHPEGGTVLNMRGLKYEQLLAPLIGAVKELKRRIEILESS